MTDETLTKKIALVADDADSEESTKRFERVHEALGELFEELAEAIPNLHATEIIDAMCDHMLMLLCRLAWEHGIKDYAVVYDMVQLVVTNNLSNLPEMWKETEEMAAESKKQQKPDDTETQH